MNKMMQIARLISERESVSLARLAFLRLHNRTPHWFYSASPPQNNLTLSKVRDLYLQQQLLWEKEAAKRPVEVATLLSTNRPWRLKAMLSMLARQRAVTLQTVVATHGFQRTEEVAGFARDLGLDVSWVVADADLSLGAVYNRILPHVDAAFVAKLDDDDFYGSYYLLDSVMQLRHSGAGITGKNSHFFFLESSQQVYLRQWNKAHRFVYWVPGPTIVAQTSLIKALRFKSTTVGEDKDLLTRAFRAGVPLYSSSPFGFVLRRGADNTWQATDQEMRDHSHLIGYRSPGAFECVS